MPQLLLEAEPIDGVGNQGHLDTQFGWSPQRLRQDLERYASLGLKVAITEADVRTFVNNATNQVPTDSDSWVPGFFHGEGYATARREGRVGEGAGGGSQPGPFGVLPYSFTAPSPSSPV